MRAPFAHPVPLVWGAISAAVGIGAVLDTPATERVLPFVNTGVLLLYVGWSARELWKLRHEVSSLKGDLMKETEALVTKSAIRAELALGTVDNRLAAEIGQMRLRMDQHLSGSNDR